MDDELTLEMPEEPVPIDEIITALLDDENPLPARYIYRLSDLNPADQVALQTAWPNISQRRRQAVLEDVEAFKDDFVLNFYELALLAVSDSHEPVRLSAFRALTDYGDANLVDVFIESVEQDDGVQIRSAALEALGNLILRGELDEIPAAVLTRVEDFLLKVCNSQDDKVVRQRALESLGFSSREEVPALIRKAYQSDDDEWTASALFAMGRSYNKIWRPDVMASLEDDRTAIRAEAITAAGELEISEALPTILESLLDPDTAVREASIWAVSQIGGEDVRDTLERLFEEVEDEEEAELIEEALENLEFTEGFSQFAILDLDEELLEDSIFDDDDLDLFPE
jgi:HEAT repeat protein